MLVTPHLKTVLKDYQHSAVKSLHGPAHHLHPPFAPPPPPSPIHSAAVPSGGGGGAGYDEGARSPVDGAAGGSAAASEVGSTTAAYVPPLPVQQMPILTTSDTSSSDLSFTPLEDVSISCFTVGGEKRLCLPQVLQSVLGDFTLAQINNQCDNLLIYCSRCTHEQLNVLKGQAILPSSAFSCGLITKSDAERLCSALLHAPASTARGLKPPALRIKKEVPTTNALAGFAEQNGDASKSANGVGAKTVPDGGNDKESLPPPASGTRTVSPPRGSTRVGGGGRVFRVRHECFGRAVGTLHEALYVAKQAKCIECVECKGWHSPQQFVKHVHWQHARGESQTVHWGFDSAKWRHYLLPLADASASTTATASNTAAAVEETAEACCTSRTATDDADSDVDRVLDLMRDRYEGVVPFAAYDVVKKEEVKKEALVNGVTKGWNMPLKRKLLHQAAKSATTTSPPPSTPPPQPPIKRDTSSPAAFAIKKPKLAMTGEDYMLMAQTYLQPAIEPYLQTAAVFQQFPLPFPYAALPPHALPLAVGGAGGGHHPSAKEAKLRQEIAERNADLMTAGGGGEAVARDSPLPPTPKKQRLIRHMQEQQRRKLEMLEVQKSPDSTTIPPPPPAKPTTPVHERRYSEIDLSTTDTEDTASEGAAPTIATPPATSSPDGEVARLLHAHPQKDHIIGMFRRLLDECDSKGGRIRELEAQLETLQRLQERLSLSSSPDEEATPPLPPPLPPPTTSTTSIAGVDDSNSPQQVQNDHTSASVITSPARPTADHEGIVIQGGGGDTTTSTSSSDDAKPHCPSTSAPAAT